MIVIGAGVAGLACARKLVESGASVRLIDKGRGVGGRAATRRIDGQPIDHGLSFFHGSHPEFLRALDDVDGATPLEGWPVDVRGNGAPCLPRAFEPGERRLAFAEGVTAFPKWLARRLDVRLGTRVASLATEGSEIALSLDDGSVLRTDTVVSTLPIEQSAILLGSLAGAREIDGVRAMLASLGTEPCLTALATYPLAINPPAWDMLYPENGSILNLVSHDSRKRTDKKFHAFVFQCAPAFSIRALESEPSQWGTRVVEEAAKLLGDWAAKPLEIRHHRWRYARSVPPNTVSGPIVLNLSGAARLALAGESFDARGGVEGAYLSGSKVAELLLWIVGLSRISSRRPPSRAC